MLAKTVTYNSQHIRLRPSSSLLCFYFYLLYYAAVLLNFTYYAHCSGTRILLSLLCYKEYNGSIFHKCMNIAINVFYIDPFMLALCFMLSVTHYAQNNAGIIGRSLIGRQKQRSKCQHNRRNFKQNALSYNSQD